MFQPWNTQSGRVGVSEETVTTSPGEPVTSVGPPEPPFGSNTNPTTGAGTVVDVVEDDVVVVVVVGATVVVVVVGATVVVVVVGATVVVVVVGATVVVVVVVVAFCVHTA